MKASTVILDRTELEVMKNIHICTYYWIPLHKDCFNLDSCKNSRWVLGTASSKLVFIYIVRTVSTGSLYKWCWSALFTLL